MKNNLEKLIKQKVPFRSNYIKAELGLIYLTSLINHQKHHDFKKYKISPQQYNVLRILRGQYPNAININAIKDRMLDKMSDVSRITSKLITLQFVSKQTNIFDKRNLDITITEKGLAILKNIDDSENEMKSVVHNVSEADIHQLNVLIDKLLDY